MRYFVIFLCERKTSQDSKKFIVLNSNGSPACELVVNIAPDYASV
jgi:hypothetical protein